MLASSQPSSGRDDRNNARHRKGAVPACQAVRSVVDDLAADFIKQATANEWQCIACGWHQPNRLVEAAEEHELCGDRFLDPQAGFVYAYVATCADRGVDPDVVHCAAVAEAQGDVDVTEGEIATLLLTTDYSAVELNTYTEGVAFNASRHERAQTLYREYVELVGGDVFDVSVRQRQSISQRQRTVIPKTLKRRRRRRVT